MSEGPAPPEPRPLRVLLVEENATHRLLTAALLQHRGCSVTFASDGFEAVRKARSLVPDLLVMDLRIPRLDGVEATRRIRASESGRRPRIPIVAVTSLTAPDHLARALEAGVDEVIDKPIHPDDLDAAIARLVGDRIGVYDPALALVRASGDPELLASALRLFLEEVPGHLAAMRAALADKEVAALCRHAHEVEEAAHALAMPRLRDLAGRVADHGGHGDLQRAAAAAGDLDSAFVRTRAAVVRGLDVG